MKFIKALDACQMKYLIIALVALWLIVLFTILTGY